MALGGKTLAGWSFGRIAGAGAAGLLALSLLAPGPALEAAGANVAEGPVADAVRKGIASGTGAFDHSRWEALVARHVDAEGQVDYAGFRKDRGALEAYLDEVGRADLASLPRGELLALFINAYNACTVRLILDGSAGGRLPASIRDLPDPWGRKTCTVGGHALSLDTIEHGILRPIFKDSRIHAAVNCASRSCPALVPWAYRGDRIEDQLGDGIEAMVNAPAHVRVEGGRLRVSRIFDWYKDDFVEGSFKEAAPTIAEYVLRHARPGLRRQIEALGPRPRAEFLDYDWSLNGR